MDRNKLLAIAAIGGFLFLSSKAKADDSALKPMVSPLIPGTGGATASTPATAPGGGMAPSKAIVDLIKKFTGFNPLPKKEPSGAVIIGYGHKVVAGDPKIWTDFATQNRSMAIEMTAMNPAQGDALFLNDLLKHVEVINRLVTVPLNQNQYDALTSLIMNIGVDNFAISTLLTKLNTKDYAGAAEQFLVWNKSRDANNNLVVNDGLTSRRAGERTLFLTPVVEVAGAAPPTTLSAEGLVALSPEARARHLANMTPEQRAFYDAQVKEKQAVLLTQLSSGLKPQAYVPLTREQHLALGHVTYNANPYGTPTYIEGWKDAAGNVVG